jgi:hypothetical protein
MITELYDNYLSTIEINESITDDVIECWDKYKTNEDNTIDVKATATFKGIQSANALHLIDFQEDCKFQEALKNILEIGEHLIKTTLYYYWVHFVEYHSGGYQGIHNHVHNEDYSLILYLNTCKGGQTEFESGVMCTPKKNQLVIFQSSINHRARETQSWDNKKVLVCGVRKS